jgi:hypothetical protein
MKYLARQFPVFGVRHLTPLLRILRMYTGSDE